MSENRNRLRRNSLRLRGYDYSQSGMYFVTVCTLGRQCILGEIIDGVMCPSAFGGVVNEELLATASIRNEVGLDEWIVMPNHLHAILAVTNESVGDDPFDWIGRGAMSHPQRQPRSLGALMAGLKSRTTSRINTLRSSPGYPVWQRGFYDHIIRSEKALDRIRRYIAENPLRWALDPDNPVNSRMSDAGGEQEFRRPSNQRPTGPKPA